MTYAEIMKRRDDIIRTRPDMSQTALDSFGRAASSAYGIIRQKLIKQRQKRKQAQPSQPKIDTKTYEDAGKAHLQGTHQNPMKAAAKKHKEPVDPVGWNFDTTNEAAVEAVRDHAADLITGVSQTTRDEIKELVEEAFTDPDMDVTSLADEIEGIIDDPDRAELIATTETMQASNDGQLAAWDQAEEDGLLTGDEEKVWIATDGERTCDICGDMDGETVARGETFDVDGDDLNGPPAHPRCRCTVGLQT